MKSVLFAAAALVASVSTGALAQTYDAFDDFNGAQSAGDSGPGPTDPQRFIYGTLTPDGTSGSFFTANSNCFIAGATACLQQAPNGLDTSSLPGFTKSLSESFQYNSVNVPDDRLLAHPGNDDLLTSVLFVAPAAGFYRYTGTFSVQDINPSGVGISFLRASPGGQLPYIVTSIGALNSANQTFTASGLVNLTASDSFGFGIDRQGNFSNDSTGVNFQVLAGIPEPATWAMMILGFGVVGAAMRRSRKPRVTTAFATA